MDSLYQEHILEHAKHPHNRRKIEDASVVQRGNNPSCGDDLVLYLKWRGDVLEDISFEGFGCAISQSGASMLTDKIMGMERRNIERFSPEDMYALYGVVISPERQSCALLSFTTLKDGLAQ